MLPLSGNTETNIVSEANIDQTSNSNIMWLQDKGNG